MIKKSLFILAFFITFSTQVSANVQTKENQARVSTEAVNGQAEASAPNGPASLPTEFLEVVDENTDPGQVDYEITIVDDAEDLFNWAQDLEVLDEPQEFSTLEDLQIYEFIYNLMPEFKVMLTAPKAQRRTCSALGSSGTGQGMASWYGGKFHGRRTANGETYNQNGLTAAHKTLPFNSIIEVTYRGKSVRVRINDAGPYHGNRVIDLSKEAARQLGFINAGTGMVTLKIISCGKK